MFRSVLRDDLGMQLISLVLCFIWASITVCLVRVSTFVWLFCIIGFCLYFYIPLLAIFVLLFTLILFFCVLSILYYIVLNERGLGGHIFFDDSVLTFALPWTASARILYCPKN